MEASEEWPGCWLVQLHPQDDRGIHYRTLSGGILVSVDVAAVVVVVIIDVTVIVVVDHCWCWFGVVAAVWF